MGSPAHMTLAADTALQWLEADPLFIDTETTGFSVQDEICEIAILDLKGRLLLNTLVKPSRPIDQRVTDVHGITNAMVADAPSFRDLVKTLPRLLHGRTLIAYNADYDARLLRQSCFENEIFLSLSNHWHCAMKLYAMFHGTPGRYVGEYAWHTLSRAAAHQDLVPDSTLHRALADAALCRRLVLHIAQQKE